jgi:DNA-binding LacI/PurR family transcriptional regulator
MGLKNTVVLLNRPEKHFKASNYYHKIKMGIDAALDGTEYELVLAKLENGLPEDVAEGMQNSGVIVIAPHINNPAIAALEDSNIPATLINCRSPKISWVDNDNVLGAATMTEYLVSLGHEKILLVNGFPDSQNSIDRLRGYKKTLEKNGIKYDLNRVINCDFSVSLSYEKMKTFLLQNKGNFSAVFCTNDYMAVGAIRALADEKIKVPDDVAVVGFDDMDFASTFYAPLTTYSQPLINFGFLAAKFLIKQMRTKTDKGLQAELLGELVIRQSCGAEMKKKAMQRRAAL